MTLLGPPATNACGSLRCRVEKWRGRLGVAYLLPTLSVAGASLATPMPRFHFPLVEPDVRIYRIRLPDELHRLALARATRRTLRQSVQRLPQRPNRYWGC